MIYCTGHEQQQQRRLFVLKTEVASQHNKLFTYLAPVEGICVSNVVCIKLLLTYLLTYKPKTVGRKRRALQRDILKRAIQSTVQKPAIPASLLALNWKTSICVSPSPRQLVFMVALCNRADHYIFTRRRS